MERVVTFDLGGTLVTVPLVWLLAFVVLLLACVIWPLWFNRSPNHEGDYVDEHWGYGDVDDDMWGLPPHMR